MFLRYNGFGSPEDSLRSVYSIRPKKPTRDNSKSEHTGRVMRFSLRMEQARAEDEQRVFTLQYYLIDDTIAIREPPLRNSGHIGGSFLLRSRVRKPDWDQVDLPISEPPAGSVWGPAPQTAYDRRRRNIFSSSFRSRRRRTGLSTNEPTSRPRRRRDASGDDPRGVGPVSADDPAAARPRLL